MDTLPELAMNDPIKPPDGPTGPDALADEPAPVEEAPGAFRAEVEAAGASQATARAADAVRSGALDTSQAIEQLVQRALAQAGGLSGPQRKALEAQLRAALESDPTLVALQEDLRSAAKV